MPGCLYTRVLGSSGTGKSQGFHAFLEPAESAFEHVFGGSFVANVTSKGLQAALQKNEVGGTAIVTAEDGQNLMQEVEDSKGTSKLNDVSGAYHREVRSARPSCTKLVVDSLIAVASGRAPRAQQGG
jgi:hypothetical protein